LTAALGDAMITTSIVGLSSFDDYGDACPPFLVTGG